ncbi:MAG: BspA family leucine-rich repeat surface protein [Paludibacteraceae bacterium]|nr:BspA family leucine-rich repeat surface protein [Paludibacteraceae bacterium]
MCEIFTKKFQWPCISHGLRRKGWQVLSMLFPLLFFSYQSAAAAEVVYGVYNESESTFTLKYGEDPGEGTYTYAPELPSGYIWEVAWEADPSSNIPKSCWKSGDTYLNGHQVTEKVVIDQSLRFYRPITIAGWFYHLHAKSIEGLENLNTRDVTSMESMFEGCAFLDSLNIGYFDATMVTNMNYMFAGCLHLKSLNIKGLNTARLRSISGMFHTMLDIEVLDVRSININMVKDAWRVFGSEGGTTKKLRTIIVNYTWDKSHFANDSTSPDQFAGCTNLVGGKGTTFKGAGSIYAHVDGGEDDPGYFTSRDDLKPYAIPYDIHYDVSGRVDSLALRLCYGVDAPNAHKFNKGKWILNQDTIDNAKVTNIVIDPSMKTYRPTSLANWFNGFSRIKTIEGMENLVTDSVRSMASMFRGCSSLVSLDLSHFRTSQVTSMKGMFLNCGSIESLDVSSFDTRNVTSMVQMFCDCHSLRSLDLSSFNTSNVTDMIYMFRDCNKCANLNLTSFNTQNITSMNGMFINCKSLDTLDLSSFDTRKVTDMEYMFHNDSSLTTIFVSDCWRTDSIVADDNMFNGCVSLVGEKGTAFDPNHKDKSYARIDEGEGNPGYLSYGRQVYVEQEGNILTFRYGIAPDNSYILRQNGNEGIEYFWQSKVNPDLSGGKLYPEKDTLVVIDPSMKAFKPYTLKNMFDGFKGIRKIEGLDNLVTDNVTDMSRMFNECCSLDSLYLGSFKTDYVTDMSGMFNGCYKLRSLYLRSFKTNNVTDMSSMFADCLRLTSLDLSSFNTSNVTDMNHMFHSMASLESIDLKEFDTRKVTNMSGMFFGCQSLTEIDIKNLETSEVTDMSAMFADCRKLASIKHSLNTKNVTTMSNMFGSCKSLTYMTQIVHTTATLKDMSYMFSACEKIAIIDLRQVDTKNVTDMNCMFAGCTNLKHIVVDDKWSTTSLETGNYIFDECTNLVGKLGTKYNAAIHYDSISHMRIDSAYAHVDGEGGKPGYLTDELVRYYVADSSAHTLTLYQGSNIPKNAVTFNSIMFNNSDTVPWKDTRSFVDTIIIDPTFAYLESYANIDNGFPLDYWFYGFERLKRIKGLENLEISVMNYTFYGCKDLEYIDLSTLRFNRSVNPCNTFNGAFAGCSSLKKIIVGDDVPMAIAYQGMFDGCDALVGGYGSKVSDFNDYRLAARVDDPDKSTGVFTYYKSSIIYNLDGGAWKDGKKGVEEFEFRDCPLTISEPVKENYIFVGWEVSQEGGSITRLDTLSTLTINQEDFFNVPYTCTALWQKDGFVITYMVDGELYMRDTLASGTPITHESIPAPKKTGYTFKGWVGKKGTPTTMPDYDLTFNALFTVNDYVLTYKVDDKVYQKDTIAFGDTITPIAGPAKKGYTFDGWVGLPETMPAENITVTGLYVQSTGLSSIGNDGLRIWTSDGSLFIHASVDSPYRIYDVRGSLVAGGVAKDVTQIPLPRQAIYVIELNGQKAKFVVY